MGTFQARILVRPPPRDLPNPAIELRSPALQEDSLPLEPPGKPNSLVQLNENLLFPLLLLNGKQKPFPGDSD